MAHELCLRWLWQQPSYVRDKILKELVLKLLDERVLSFRIDDIVDLDGRELGEDETMEEFLYWTATKQRVDG